MIKTGFVVMLQACLWLVAPIGSPVTMRHEVPQNPSTSVTFFDVLDLPARIDEPKLSNKTAGYILNCAVANRSGEQLSGVHLILIVVEPSGKLRSRISWNEATELGAYSIKLFEFHPVIKDELRKNDQLFIIVDEIIGRETIWRAVDADKALRAYARGQHDVIPQVKTGSNKFDPRPGLVVVPLEKQK